MLAKAFARVLSDPEVRQNIDVIAVQGHTDSRGSAAYNRQLSAQRASAVLDHMFQAEPRLADEYGRYFAASAYSEFRPIADEETEEAHQQNRRIEIAVMLWDSRVREVIDAYLDGQDPRLDMPRRAGARPVPDSAQVPPAPPVPGSAPLPDRRQAEPGIPSPDSL